MSVPGGQLSRRRGGRVGCCALILFILFVCSVLAIPGVAWMLLMSIKVLTGG